MEKQYGIGEVTQRYHVSHKTLHHYEKLGLLESARDYKTANRSYEPKELKKLEAILILRQLGLGLPTIISLYDSESKESILRALNQKIAEIDSDIRNLRRQKQLISWLTDQFSSKKIPDQAQLTVLPQISKIVQKSGKSEVIVNEGVFMVLEDNSTHEDLEDDVIPENIVAKDSEEQRSIVAWERANRYGGEFICYQNPHNSWPSQIFSFEQVPLAFKPFFPYHKENFPYTIYIPDENYSFYKKKGYLLIIQENSLFVFEKMGNKIRSVVMERESIQFIVLGSVLLFSWLEFYGEGFHFNIPFNSIMTHLFEPIVDYCRNTKVKGMAIKKDELDNFVESINDEPLKKNFTFQNILRYPFLRLSSAAKVFFQQQALVDSTKIPFIKKVIFKRYVTNHLNIINEDEIIFVQENRMIHSSDKKTYNKIFEFIQISSLDHFSYDDTDKCFNVLTLVLSSGRCFKRIFSKDNQQVHGFMRQLKELIQLY
jgi:MerR family copper efflux transcriptional regulator